LQAALDDWAAAVPGLTEKSPDALELGHRAFAVRPAQCRAAAWPRAFQGRLRLGATSITSRWCARRAGVEMPASFWTDARDVPGRFDVLWARAIHPVVDEAWGIDLEAEVVVSSADVPDGRDARRKAGLGDPPDHAGQRVSCRNLTGPGARKGFGFVQVETGLGVYAGAWTPDETWVMRLTAPGQPAAAVVRQRQALRQARSAATHDLRTFRLDFVRTSANNEPRALGAGTIWAPARSRTATPTAARAILIEEGGPGLFLHRPRGNGTVEYHPRGKPRRRSLNWR